MGESCACNKPEIIILLNQNKRAPNITFLPLEAIYQNKHASNVTFLVLSISHLPKQARFKCNNPRSISPGGWGGISLLEANGDVPLDGVASLRLG